MPGLDEVLIWEWSSASICIPAYEMHGEGAKFIARALASIRTQTFTDYETIVSDHSADDKVQEACAPFPKVRYLKNPVKRGISSANLNHAINHAKGSHIKVLFQDDFLSDHDSLARMVDGIGVKAWLVHGYWHTDIAGEKRFSPTQPSIPEKPRTLLRLNTIGAPSAIMFKKCDLRFDETLRWMMDCEFYYKLLRNFGPPVIISDPLAVQTLWPGQLTNHLRNRVRVWESYWVRKVILEQFFVRLFKRDPAQAQ